MDLTRREPRKTNGGYKMATYEMTLKELTPEQVQAIRKLLTKRQDMLTNLRNESKAAA